MPPSHRHIAGPVAQKPKDKLRINVSSSGRQIRLLTIAPASLDSLQFSSLKYLLREEGHEGIRNKIRETVAIFAPTRPLNDVADVSCLPNCVPSFLFHCCADDPQRRPPMYANSPLGGHLSQFKVKSNETGAEGEPRPRVDGWKLKAFLRITSSITTE